MRDWTVDDSSSQDVIFNLPSLVEKQNHAFMSLPYIYQSAHSISFPLSTHFISLPCKMDGKEGQSVDTNFWHLVELILHQHRCSKFLIKSRIIWSNYIKIKNQGYILLHVTEIKDLHCTSFYVAFHVISHRISRIAHFMHCTAYHVILCIISCHFIMRIHFILIHAI